MSESRVTWATSVPILVFLGLSVHELGPMYATDKRSDVRQTKVRQKHRLMPPPYGGACILTEFNIAEVLSNIYAIFNKHIIVAGNDRESSNAVYMTLSLSLSLRFPFRQVKQG